MANKKGNYKQTLVGLLNGDLLVDGVDILGRFSLWRRNDKLVVVVFDDGNGDIFLLTGASESAIEYNGEDPYHANEDADAAADNECDSSTLPSTEIHERMVQPGQKGAVVVMMI